MITATISEGNTTVTIEYTALSGKMANILEYAAHKLFLMKYDEDSLSFDSLTNQQKLNLIDTEIKRYISAMAQEYKNRIDNIVSMEENKINVSIP